MCLIFGRRSVVGPPSARDRSYRAAAMCAVCALDRLLLEKFLKTWKHVSPLSLPIVSLIIAGCYRLSVAFFFGRRPCKERRERCWQCREWTMMACRRCLSLLLRTSRMATNEQHTRRRREIFNFFKYFFTHSSMVCSLRHMSQRQNKIEPRI